MHKSKDINIINLKIRVNCETVTAKIAVKDCPATLADVVPTARMLSAKINQAIDRHAINSGISIPCQQGCANCCHLLIILSVPEALRLAEELILMPLSEYEKLRRYWDSISNFIREQLPMNSLPRNLNYIDYPNLRAISNWYTKQRKPCVFLQDNICAIYEQRPLVCRDFIIMGSSSQCQLGKVSVKTAVKTSPSMSYVLRQLASEFEYKGQKIVFLHNLFNWYEENIKLYDQMWPATVLVQRFIELLTYTQQSKPSNFVCNIHRQKSVTHKTMHLTPVTK